MDNKLIDIAYIKECCPQAPVEKILNEKKVYKVITDFNQLKTKSEANKINRSLLKYEEYDKGGVWMLLGYVGENDWRCVEVGSSSNIINEIRGIILDMVNESYLVYKDSLFHSEKPLFEFRTYSEKTNWKYRRINSLFDRLAFIEINVEEYLRDVDIGEYNQIDYTEVRLAFETKALTWNPAPNIKKQEIEILRDIYEISWNSRKKCTVKD